MAFLACAVRHGRHGLFSQLPCLAFLQDMAAVPCMGGSGMGQDRLGWEEDDVWFSVSGWHLHAPLAHTCMTTSPACHCVCCLCPMKHHLFAFIPSPFSTPLPFPSLLYPSFYSPSPLLHAAFLSLSHYTTFLPHTPHLLCWWMEGEDRGTGTCVPSPSFYHVPILWGQMT